MNQAQGGVQPFQRAFGVVKVHVAVVQIGAVVRAYQKKPHRLGLVPGQHLADGEKIAQAFGHLLVVHLHHAVVHPEHRQRLASGTFALRNLVLVVGKLQINTAAVDVKRLTQSLAAHGRALNVPAGAAASIVMSVRSAVPIGAVPLGIFRLRFFSRFPQHKIQWVALVVLNCNALARAQVVQRLAGQLAVAGELAHGKVHIAAGCLVGQAFGLQPVDQCQHLGHVLRGARLQRGRLYAQPADVGAHDLDHFVSERADGDVALKRPLDDFVVNVGDVAHVGDAQAAGFEPALYHVKRHRHAGVADVAQVINRHAADVHAHMAGVDRGELFKGTRQRVVDAQTHGTVSGKLSGGNRLELSGRHHPSDTIQASI